MLNDNVNNVQALRNIEALMKYETREKVSIEMHTTMRYQITKPLGGQQEEPLTCSPVANYLGTLYFIIVRNNPIENNSLSVVFHCKNKPESSSLFFPSSFNLSLLTRLSSTLLTGVSWRTAIPFTLYSALGCNLFV